MTPLVGADGVNPDGWTTFTFDSRGNQTAQELPAGDTFTTYDAANQATLVETPNSTVEMTYNAMYQRVQKAVDGGPTTRFIYDHKRLLAETDENDTTTRSFTSGTAGANSEYGDLVSEYDAQSLEVVGTWVQNSSFVHATQNHFSRH